ncbi:MAG: family 16 glycosylhydrolase [Methylacidiphilales bacterium]|nr:family 16 glycosylhydrolase [Candidatus Methylacidiphilales bacterium]
MNALKRFLVLSIFTGFLCHGIANGQPTFANPSFETPSVGTGYTYSSTGSSWTFTNNAGITGTGSGTAYGAPTPPNGTQTGLLQGVAGTLGAMSQSVSFTAGTYTISFYGAQRSGQVQPILVSVDGTPVGTYTPGSSSFALITTAPFTVAAGSHTVTFAATNNSADKTSFIDEVSISTSGGGGGAPAAPTGLAATGGNAQISLSWTASSGATSYNVYRGTSSGGESGTPIATGITAANYNDTGLTNGTAYFYKVAAVNSSGTSGYSNEASATPSGGGGSGPAFANPSFETPSIGNYSYSPVGSSWTFTSFAGITATGSGTAYGAASAPDGTQVALVEGISGSSLGTMSQSVTFPAGTYTISFYGAQRYSQVQPIQVSVDSTVIGTYTPASNGFAQITTASFTVTAGNHTVTFAATDSSADKTSFIDLVSISSSGGGGGGAPAAPSGLTATSGNAQVVLNWTGSSGATSYNVYRGTSSGGESTTPIATGVSGTNYSDTSVSNGTAYFYKVAAVNSSGTSGYSNEASATPSSGGGGGSATFANASFETPSVGGGYTYSSTGTSWTFTNNAGITGTGGAYGAPTPPNGTQTGLLQGVSGTLGSMSQSVSFPAGTYTISFYGAQRSGQVQPILVSVDGTAVGTYTPAGSTFAQITTASFTVTAGNHTVTFAATTSSSDKTSFIDELSISSTGGGGSAPAAPTGLAATAGNAQVSLSWSASTGATSYNVYRGPSAGGESTTPIATGISSTSYTDSSVTNGTTYFYKVAAVNSYGTSGYSNEVSAMPSSGGGGGGGSATFANASFETPSVGGGYTYSSTGTSWTFTNNAGITGAGGAYGAPTPPNGTQTGLLQGVGGTLGSMSQSVSFPAGTYTISFYGAQRFSQVQPIQVSVDSTVIGSYTPASNGFAQITTAAFTVAAGNHTVTFAATSNSSDKTSFIDEVSISTGSGGGGGSPPAAPTGLAATPGNMQVSLTWTASSGATSYNIYQGTTAGGEGAMPIATGITTTSYTNTGLTNGTVYYYKVVAVNSYGSSGYSSEVSATPSGGGGSGDINLTGYTRTFDEEFTNFSVTTASPKGSSTWYYEPPYGSAGEYSESIWDVASFSVNGGILSDTAYLDSSSNWHSGNLSSIDPTKAGFSQQYGYFEICCQMPNSGEGAWPAFWLETTSSFGSGAEQSEEVDIFEWYGVCNTPGSLVPYVQEATHNWNLDGSQNQTLPYLYSPQTEMPGGVYPWQAYHIYGCQVDQNHITWYIDGVQTNQIATPTAYLTGPFYMMVDYALGGGWPLSGMVNNSSLNVKWVRAYSLPGQ